MPVFDRLRLRQAIVGHVQISCVSGIPFIYPGTGLCAKTLTSEGRGHSGSCSHYACASNVQNEDAEPRVAPMSFCVAYACQSLNIYVCTYVDSQLTTLQSCIRWFIDGSCSNFKLKLLQMQGVLRIIVMMHVQVSNSTFLVQVQSLLVLTNFCL